MFSRNALYKSTFYLLTYLPPNHSATEPQSQRNLNSETDDTVVTVAHAEDDLRCSVVTRDDVGSHHEAGSRGTCQTEVQYLQRTVTLHYDVGRLQILIETRTRLLYVSTLLHRAIVAAQCVLIGPA